MTSTDTRPVDTGSSGVDQLREAVVDYLGVRAERLADSAGDKVAGLTDKLLDVAEGGGNPGGGLVKALVKRKAGSVKDNLVGKVKSMVGGGGGRKSGDTKVMNIIEALDVGVPIRNAYDHWTQYEAFSGFTKGVRSVARKDDVSSDWKVKVGPSTRGWSATVQEQIPDDRIVWTSEGAKGSTRGCVSFHELTPSLTRIVLVVEYYPSGFFEKTGNLWRAQGRRLRLDFKNFQRHVTLTEEEPEGWRGEIRDGEVVVSHEDALEEEEAAQEDEEHEGEDEHEGEGEDEQADEEAEGAEDEEADEDEQDDEEAEGAEDEEADEDEQDDEEAEEAEDEDYDEEDEQEDDEEDEPRR
ncbi:SRPBCC family protein [Streptomyces xantholiticus]|uniref:SRPBCC family protein n=1 Tax=Streptomyces xantholiticus TaxID=68285 RepID=UPI001671F897|nr:SRPBCC family protein [Streptomyces xantholiticus]GGW26405.1 hypothetical protein GCM10010381_08210 [Streptomyces xantholiticus]